MGFDEEYAHHLGGSYDLFQRASAVIPGGAGSSARTVQFGWRPYPPFITDGAGSRLTSMGTSTSTTSSVSVL